MGCFSDNDLKYRQIFLSQTFIYFLHPPPKKRKEKERKKRAGQTFELDRTSGSSAHRWARDAFTDPVRRTRNLHLIHEVRHNVTINKRDSWEKSINVSTHGCLQECRQIYRKSEFCLTHLKRRLFSTATCWTLVQTCRTSFSIMVQNHVNAPTGNELLGFIIIYIFLNRKEVLLPK